MIIGNPAGCVKAYGIRTIDVCAHTQAPSAHASKSAKPSTSPTSKAEVLKAVPVPLALPSQGGGAAGGSVGGKAVTAVCIAGSLMCTASATGEIAGWNLKRGGCGGEEAVVPLWRLASGLRCITALALEPTDARLLAAASSHGEVLFWDVGQPFTEPVAALAAHVHSITSVAFSGDGCLFATASQDKTLRVWALIRTSDAPPTLTQSSKDNPVPSPPTPRSALTRGESGLCNAHDGESPRARDASTQTRLRVLHRLVGHSEAVTAMAFVPVGSNGAVGEQGLHRSSDALGRLDAAHLLASTSIDGSVRLWNLATGQPLLPVLRPLGRACSVSCVAFAPDAQQVAAGCDDGTVRVWSLKHMSLKQSSSKTSELRVQEKLVLRAKSAIDVLVDSLKTLAPDSLDHLRNLSLPASAGMRAGESCSSGRAGAWQVPEAQRTQCVDGHRLPLSSLFYTRSGTLLVSACAGGQVKIWSAVEGALLRTVIRSPQGVAVGCVALATEPMVWAACSDGVLRGARSPDLEAEALVAAARTVL